MPDERSNGVSEAELDRILQRGSQSAGREIHAILEKALGPLPTLYERITTVVHQCLCIERKQLILDKLNGPVPQPPKLEPKPHVPEST